MQLRVLWAPHATRRHRRYSHRFSVRNGRRGGHRGGWENRGHWAHLRIYVYMCICIYTHIYIQRKGGGEAGAPQQHICILLCTQALSTARRALRHSNTSRTRVCRTPCQGSHPLPRCEGRRATRPKCTSHRESLWHRATPTSNPWARPVRVLSPRLPSRARRKCSAAALAHLCRPSHARRSPSRLAPPGTRAFLTRTRTR